MCSSSLRPIFAVRCGSLALLEGRLVLNRLKISVSLVWVAFRSIPGTQVEKTSLSL